MRCKNCGWENPGESMTCEKCNAPLNGSMGGGMPQYHPSTVDEKVNLKMTVSEKNAFGSVVSDSVPSSCPKCGYPAARDSRMCPMCGASLSDSGHAGFNEPKPVESSSRKCLKCSCVIPQSSKFCPSCGAPVRLGTVNPWMTPQTGTFCTLKPLAWQNEGIEFNPLSYSGENILLNRANTDPNNQNITSKEQAELIYENGSWYIVDKSEQQTTYVHVGRKTKLESGDIIILGNRRFEFKG